MQADRYTLLDRFIMDEAKAYIEPSRRGTPRGEPIGLSRQKFAATLHCLKSVRLEKLALPLKVSHGLLRKWRTEDDFQKQVKTNQDRFSEKFLDHLKERARKQYELRQAYIRRPLGDLAKTPPPLLATPEFNDLSLYNPALVDRIIEHVEKHLEMLKQTSALLGDQDFFSEDKAISWELKEQFQRWIDLVIGLGRADFYKNIWTYIDQKKTRAAKDFEAIRRFLLRETPSESERKIALELTYRIQDSYTLIDMGE